MKKVVDTLVYLLREVCVISCCAIILYGFSIMVFLAAAQTAFISFYVAMAMLKLSWLFLLFMAGIMPAIMHMAIICAALLCVGALILTVSQSGANNVSFTNKLTECFDYEKSKFYTSFVPHTSRGQVLGGPEETSPAYRINRS